MRELTDPRDMDAENFYRLVLIVRSIAIVRPHNLAKFAEQHSAKTVDEASSESEFRYNGVSEIYPVPKRCWSKN